MLSHSFEEYRKYIISSGFSLIFHVDFHYHRYITYGHIQQCGLRVVLYELHLRLPWFLFKDIPKNIFINCTGHYSSLLYGWFTSYLAACMWFIRWVLWCLGHQFFKLVWSGSNLEAVIYIDLIIVLQIFSCLIENRMPLLQCNYLWERVFASHQIGHINQYYWIQNLWLDFKK